MPAAPKAHAVTPSLGPQPPTFSGRAMARSASTISGTSSVAGAVDPAVRAARRNMPRCPASTARDEISTPGQLPGASSPRRASASVARTARCQRDVLCLPRSRTAPTITTPDITRRTDRAPGAVAVRSARWPILSSAREGCVSRSVTPTAARTTWPATLEDDGADPPADVPCALPMPHTTVYVAEDATGQRRVQEQSTVVVGDGPTQRQPYAQPFRHQAPTPRTAHGGEHAETESGQECGAVDPAHAVQDDGGALPPQQPRDDGRSGEHAETGPHDPRRHEDPPVGPGRASTSL